MDIKRIFKEELNNPETRYFLLVSGHHDGDLDFQQYTWNTSNYNKVRPGDLFLYRKLSGNKTLKQLYFYGVGRVAEIKPKIPGSKEVIATLDKTYPFVNNVTGDMLLDYDWKWHPKKRDDWQQFFGNYGMDNVPKEDFLHILQIGFEDIDIENEPDSPDQATIWAEFIAKMENSDFSVDDKISKAKRRVGQSVFSKNVKTIYEGKCCMCEISTKSFLVGSHIIPWAVKKETRLDPANGLCLCALHDKAFDKGYITVKNDYSVQKSERIKDEALDHYLAEIDGEKIRLPKHFKPKKVYLKYHQENIFNKFK